MMLRITLPDNNIPEREYIIRFLFADLLGLPFSVNTDANASHYSISFESNEIIIRDGFFSLNPEPLSYLKKEALPGKIVFVRNEFTTEDDIPVIFGTDEMLVTEHRIICGIDIFASAFFMLSRWEEYVNRSRDDHDRFPGSESIALKHGFLHRPVVNEYAEMLWNMLCRLGYSGERRHRSYEPAFTHDVDILDYPSAGRAIAADILKRKDIKGAVKHLKHYLKTGQSPYDFFDFLMDSSEELGAQSHFYFMASSSNMPRDPKSYLDSKRFRAKIREIKGRGHIIGFHPGYYTYNDPERWTAEKENLEKAADTSITEGRQHYLRFDIEKTLRIWEMNNMEIDSTPSYAQDEGFRCGTGDVFHVFDFLQRRQLKLKERPLVVMDGTLHQYKKYSHEKALSVVRHYISAGRKYNSPVTLLFHNSSFYGEWEGYSSVYSRILCL